MPLPIPIEHPSQDMGTRAKNAMLTALAFLAYVAVATFILAAIFYFRLTWCLNGYFAIALPMGLTVLTVNFFGLIFGALNWAVDWFTVAFLSWNIVMSGKLMPNHQKHY